jgi:hypothetical protein
VGTLGTRNAYGTSRANRVCLSRKAQRMITEFGGDEAEG